MCKRLFIYITFSTFNEKMMCLCTQKEYKNFRFFLSFTSIDLHKLLYKLNILNTRFSLFLFVSASFVRCVFFFSTNVHHFKCPSPVKNNQCEWIMHVNCVCVFFLSFTSVLCNKRNKMKNTYFLLFFFII